MALDQDRNKLKDKQEWTLRSSEDHGVPLDKTLKSSGKDGNPSDNAQQLAASEESPGGETNPTNGSAVDSCAPERSRVNLGIDVIFNPRTRPFHILNLIFSAKRIILPESERQFTVDSPLSKDEVLAKLAMCRHSSKDSIKCRVRADKFDLLPPSNLLLALFAPRIQGFVRDTGGGGSQICLRTGVSPYVAGWMSAPLPLLGSILASYAIASYLLPHPILLFYSLIGALAIPILSATVSMAISRVCYRPGLEIATSQLFTAIEGTQVEEDDSPWPEMPPKALLPQQALASAICAVLFLGAAFGLHALAWQYWVDGKYEECAQLCQPLEKLAEAILGKNSATVGDCNYYLAECYRCNGNLEKAATLYKEAAASMLPTLGSDNAFYSDALYNLGRVQEAQGNLKGASENVRTALDVWKKSPLIGDNNIVYAKGLDRFASIELKMHNPDRAEKLLEAAATIDERYGAMAAPEEITNDRAAVAIMKGRYAEASKLVSDALQAVKLNKYTEIALRINYAKASLESGSMAEAQTQYEKAMGLLQQQANQPFRGAPAVSAESLIELSKAYGRAANKSHASYEVPNFQTRSAITFNGDGRI